MNENHQQGIIVSVICMTYNHEPYVAKALGGFLMQETSFPIEIIVHDDASTDSTASVIRDYDTRNPGRFRCVFQTENQYGQRGLGLFHDLIYPQASGEFIAICEGDDYWTDPKKLEKQVTFMKQYPDLSMSFHAARVEYADRKRPATVRRYGGGQFVKDKEVVLGGGGLYPTCSSMFRRDVFENYPRFLMVSPIGDAMSSLNAITKGSVGYIDEVMAVYNCGVPGSFTQRANNRTLSESLEFNEQLDAAYAEFDRFTNYKYSKWIRKCRSKGTMRALMAGVPDSGGYKEFLRMRRKMTLEDQIRFFLGCAYLRLKRWLRRLGENKESRADA